jgi:hypothetical protein
MTMTSVESTSDPCPEIPKQFVDPTRIVKLARELKTKAAPREEAAKESSEPEAGAEVLASSEPTWKPPEVKEKRLVGSRVRWPMFGPILAQAAWAWGLFAAKRKAFIADGSENNWTIWRQHFSSFEPILDFIHALSYVFAAALAARPFAEGWRIYQEWIAWTWKGEVAKVIEQFNQRVKGTEKFWSEVGAEAMLQLRGDHLSDHSPLEQFWHTRQETQSGQRSYAMAA